MKRKLIEAEFNKLNQAGNLKLESRREKNEELIRAHYEFKEKAPVIPWFKRKSFISAFSGALVCIVLCLVVCLNLFTQEERVYRDRDKIKIKTVTEEQLADYTDLNYNLSDEGFNFQYATYSYSAKTQEVKYIYIEYKSEDNKNIYLNELLDKDFNQFLDYSIYAEDLNFVKYNDYIFLNEMENSVFCIYESPETKLCIMFEHIYKDEAIGIINKLTGTEN